MSLNPIAGIAVGNLAAEGQGVVDEVKKNLSGVSTTTAMENLPTIVLDGGQFQKLIGQKYPGGCEVTPGGITFPDWSLANLNNAINRFVIGKWMLQPAAAFGALMHGAIGISQIFYARFYYTAPNPQSVPAAGSPSTEGQYDLALRGAIHVGAATGNLVTLGVGYASWAAIKGFPLAAAALVVIPTLTTKGYQWITGEKLVKDENERLQEEEKLPKTNLSKEIENFANKWVGAVPEASEEPAALVPKKPRKSFMERATGAAGAALSSLTGSGKKLQEEVNSNSSSIQGQAKAAQKAAQGALYFGAKDLPNDCFDVGEPIEMLAALCKRDLWTWYQEKNNPGATSLNNSIELVRTLADTAIRGLVTYFLLPVAALCGAILHSAIAILQTGAVLIGQQDEELLIEREMKNSGTGQAEAARVVHKELHTLSQKVAYHAVSAVYNAVIAFVYAVNIVVPVPLLPLAVALLPKQAFAQHQKWQGEFKEGNIECVSNDEGSSEGNHPWAQGFTTWLLGRRAAAATA